MFDTTRSGTGSDRTVLSRVEALSHQLQEILDKLKINAEHLSGDLFHHDALFQESGCSRLDEKLQDVIAELKLLSLGIDE